MKRSKKRTGATAVEFAIAASILFLIIFASIEFVRLSIIKHTVEDASYAGARRAIIMGASAAEVEQAAQDHLQLYDVKQAVVTISPNPITDDTEVVEVQVSAPIGPNAWIAPAYFNSAVAGQTRMLAERNSTQMQEASTKATFGRQRKGNANGLGNGNANGLGNGNGTGN